MCGLQRCSVYSFVCCCQCVNLTPVPVALLPKSCHSGAGYSAVVVPPATVEAHAAFLLLMELRSAPSRLLCSTASLAMLGLTPIRPSGKEPLKRACAALVTRGCGCRQLFIRLSVAVANASVVLVCTAGCTASFTPSAASSAWAGSAKAGTSNALGQLAGQRLIFDILPSERRTLHTVRDDVAHVVHLHPTHDRCSPKLF
jgi:hypothetical protein